MDSKETEKKSAVRLMTEGDIQWALELAERCYKIKLDKTRWENWVKAALAAPYVLILVGSQSVVVSVIQEAFPGAGFYECVFPYWFSESKVPRELIEMFFVIETEMTTRGAKRFWIKPTTGVDATPLAHVLKYTKAFATFLKETGHA